jgi:NAD(P)-dependent dehydrogenase (short-subunit alcohol dehydrogenase family)
MISPTWVRTKLMDADVAQIARRSGGEVDAHLRSIAAQNPQKRIIEPEETAAIAVFLCSDGARGINTDNIVLSGGAVW